MYSHELQTCDWPRNVGCEVTETYTKSPTDIATTLSGGYHIPPHKFRFSSVQSSPKPSQASSSVSPILSQYTQQQSLPPPPELKVPPNPIITSRGQPLQHQLEQIDIAKVSEIWF